MKYLIIVILFIVVFFSCCTDEKNSERAFIDERLKRSFDFLIYQKDVLYNGIVYQTKSIDTVTPGIEQSKNLHIIFNKVITTIDSLTFSSTKKEVQIEDLPIIKQYFTSINSILESFSCSKKIKYKSDSLIYRIEEMKYSDLQLLRNQVAALNFHILDFLYKMVEYPDLRMNKLVSVAVPEKTTLRRGELYKAEVYLAIYDTNSNNLVLVDGDTLKVEKGICKYELKSESKGIFIKKGKLLVEINEYRNKEFPFNIEFEVE